MPSEGELRERYEDTSEDLRCPHPITSPDSARYWHHCESTRLRAVSLMTNGSPKTISSGAFAVLLLCSVESKLTRLENAKIYTLDSSRPWASSFIYDDTSGLIVTVDDMVSVVDESFDMKGRLVLPGFQDPHLHVVEAGINANICYVGPYAPIREVPLWLKDDSCPFKGEFGDQGWIVGAGIDIGTLLERKAINPNLPHPIEVLDQAWPDDPVFILDALGHGAIANTVAMEQVGFGNVSTDPPGGKLVRDDTTEQLTGIVLENAQQRLREAAFPVTSANEQVAYEGLIRSLKTLAANGITAVSDAGGFWRQAQVESWSRAEAEGLLTVRASNALYVYPDIPLDEQLPQLLQLYSNVNSSLVRFDQAKVYVDGILSLESGALYEPYTTGSGTGFEYFGNATTLNAVSQALADEGFKLHFHTTGDRGAGLALDAIEQLSGSTLGSPHRITHLYLVAESDRPRFTSLGVVGDFQIAPSSIERETTEFLSTLIGEDRVGALVPAKELYDAGASLVISSDWDADELSPLIKIQTVLTRQDGRGFDSVEEVLPLMTRNVGEFLGNNAGVLRSGRAADIVVLSDNILEMDAKNIGRTKAVATLFNGKPVFDRIGLFGDVLSGASAVSTTFWLISLLGVTASLM